MKKLVYALPIPFLIVASAPGNLVANAELPVTDAVVAIEGGPALGGCDRCEPAGGGGNPAHEDHSTTMLEGCAPGFCFSNESHSGTEPSTCSTAHGAYSVACDSQSLLEDQVYEAVKFLDAKSLVAAVDASERDDVPGNIILVDGHVVVESCDGDEIWAAFELPTEFKEMMQ